MRTVKLLFIAVLLPGMFIPKALPQENKVNSLNSIFYKANLLYEEKEYDQAIKQYSAIIDKGYVSGNLYYNLGNCYYKKGLNPQALLYYERARRFIPGDADLESNYQYVRSLINISYQEPKPNFLFRLLNKTGGRLNFNEGLILIFILNALIFLVLTARLFSAGFRKLWLYIFLLLLIILFAEAYYFYGQAAKIGRAAIIITDEVKAKFEPQDKATDYFAIYGGEKVMVISPKGEWVKIKRLDGKTGWIPKSALEKI